MKVKIIYNLIKNIGLLDYFPCIFCVLNNGEIRILKYNRVFKLHDEECNYFETEYIINELGLSSSQNNLYVCATIDDLVYSKANKSQELCIKEIIGIDQFDGDNTRRLADYMNIDNESNTTVISESHAGDTILSNSYILNDFRHYMNMGIAPIQVLPPSFIMPHDD